MDLATRKMVYYGLLGLLIAGSVIAVFRIAPPTIGPFAKDGTLNVYMSSIQPDIQGNPIIPAQTSQVGTVQVVGRLNLLSLNVTIDSVIIHANGESESDGATHSTSFTFDVLKPFSVSTLISSEKVPVENVTMVGLHVSKAVAAVAGISGLVSVKVPSGELKIPISPALHVDAQKTSGIVISGSAHVIEANGDIILTPVLHVEKTTGPD